MREKKTTRRKRAGYKERERDQSKTNRGSPLPLLLKLRIAHNDVGACIVSSSVMRATRLLLVENTRWPP